MLLKDTEILERCRNEGMISPFVETLVSKIGDKKIISKGLSSAGYDISVSDEYKIFSNARHTVVDPKDFDEDAFIEHRGDTCIIPPNSFVLCRSVEKVNIPRDIMSVAIGKSSIARAGLVVGITPIEPGFKGDITIEISNTTPLPARVHSFEGIAQLLFFKLSGDGCKVSYSDRAGKYQNQTGVVPPRI